jgi:glycosyltransferase involved in cell wall biosynthesis
LTPATEVPGGLWFDDAVPETDRPLFSVVIPTFQRGELLPRAVASVLAQTVEDLEVIVVDDAGGAVDVPPDPRVRVVHRTTNGGPGACRNTGVDVATGRYVAFLDDDDVWVPYRLELALAGLARAPITICWGRYDDEPPGPGRVLEGDVADEILDGVTPHLDVTALERSVYVPHDERYRASEDVEWWLRQAAVAPVATVARTGAVIRRSGDGNRPEVIAARLADGRQMIDDNRAWFDSHPRAEAMRWQRIGVTALAVGDVATARSASRRSFWLHPGIRPLAHVVRSRRARSGTHEPVDSASRLRILQVVTDTDRRGAQVFATDLGVALEARGHHVKTVALTAGTSSVALGLDTLGPRRLASATLRELRRVAFDAEVVIAHGSSTLPACAVGLAGTGVPFVYRQISDSLFWAPDRRRQARVRAFLARAAGVVALSAAQASVLRTHFGVGGGRLDVIPNGVPAEAFPVVDAVDRAEARSTFAIPDEALVVLTISALVPEKGVDLVIDAIARLDDERMHLLIVGDGPERSELERRAAAHDAVRERVLFTGGVADAHQAFAAADVMVLASRGGDSMPATLVEATFCGVPVVATPVGAITDVIVDGDTGVIVPVGDAAALAAAVRALFDDPVGTRAISVRARLRSLQRFEISAIAEQWEGVLAAHARRAAP